ncbi:unnamed protein product [Amoebophrya sp. A120]|nr:unnamed protein product [Amoebophrya sp. A120]|eukprot:GSA120T00020058001.1
MSVVVVGFSCSCRSRLVNVCSSTCSCCRSKNSSSCFCTKKRVTKPKPTTKILTLLLLFSLSASCAFSTTAVSSQRLCPLYEPTTRTTHAAPDLHAMEQVDFFGTTKTSVPCNCSLARQDYLTSAFLKPAEGSPQGVFAAQINLHAPGGYGRFFSDVVREHGSHESSGLWLFLSFLHKARLQIRKAAWKRKILAFAQKLLREVERDEAGLEPNSNRTKSATIFAGASTPLTTDAIAASTSSDIRFKRRTRYSLAELYHQRLLGAGDAERKSRQNSPRPGTTGPAVTLFPSSKNVLPHVSGALTLSHIRQSVRQSYAEYVNEPCVELNNLPEPENNHLVLSAYDHLDIPTDRQKEATDPAAEMLLDWLYEEVLAKGKILWKDPAARRTALGDQDVPDDIVLQEAWSYASDYHGSARSANLTRVVFGGITSAGGVDETKKGGGDQVDTDRHEEQEHLHEDNNENDPTTDNIDIFDVEPRMTFLDLGSNLGMWSLLAAVVHKAEVFAFEPVLGNVRKLLDTLFCDNKELLLHNYANHFLHVVRAIVGAPETEGEERALSLVNWSSVVLDERDVKENDLQERNVVWPQWQRDHGQHQEGEMSGEKHQQVDGDHLEAVEDEIFDESKDRSSSAPPSSSITSARQQHYYDGKEVEDAARATPSYLGEDRHAASLAVQEAAKLQLINKHDVSVRLHTVDTIWNKHWRYVDNKQRKREHKKRDLIVKADVEGYECAALLGAAEFLRHSRVWAVMFEYSAFWAEKTGTNKNKAGSDDPGSSGSAGPEGRTRTSARSTSRPPGDEDEDDIENMSLPASTPSTSSPTTCTDPGIRSRLSQLFKDIGLTHFYGTGPGWVYPQFACHLPNFWRFVDRSRIHVRNSSAINIIGLPEHLEEEDLTKLWMNTNLTRVFF